MPFNEEEIKELKTIASNISFATEGGYEYILIEKLQLPDGCNPSEVDALLCPTTKDGYESRLFFSSQISGCPSRNWNGNIRVLDRNWYAFSWRINSQHSLTKTLLLHLNSLQK